jgi:hypothetical protein
VHDARPCMTRVGRGGAGRGGVTCRRKWVPALRSAHGPSVVLATPNAAPTRSSSSEAQLRRQKLQQQRRQQRRRRRTTRTRSTADISSPTQPSMYRCVVEVYIPRLYLPCACCQLEIRVGTDAGGDHRPGNIGNLWKRGGGISAAIFIRTRDIRCGRREGSLQGGLVRRCTQR